MYSYNTENTVSLLSTCLFSFYSALKKLQDRKKTYLTGLQENQFNLSEHCVCMNLMQENLMFQHSGSRCFSLMWGRLEISF